MPWNQTPYTNIADAEVSAEQPITQSLMFRLRDNAFGGMQGQAAALADDRGVWVEKGGQNAIQTDVTDQSRVLSPDGSGSAIFKAPGQFLNAAYGGIDQITGSLSSNFGGFRFLNLENGNANLTNMSILTDGSGLKVLSPNAGYGGLYQITINGQARFSGTTSDNVAMLVVEGTAGSILSQVTSRGSLSGGGNDRIWNLSHIVNLPQIVGFSIAFQIGIQSFSRIEFNLSVVRMAPT